MGSTLRSDEFPVQKPFVPFSEDEFIGRMEAAGDILGRLDAIARITGKSVGIGTDFHCDLATLEQFLSGEGTLVLGGDVINGPPRKYENCGSVLTLYTVAGAVMRRPGEIIYTRGDHEFEGIFNEPRSVNGGCLGLDLQELKWTKAASVVKRFVQQLPYAAVTANNYLIVHGGVPRLQSADQFWNLEKGLVSYKTNPVVEEMMWNEFLHPNLLRHMMRTKRAPDDDGIISPGRSSQSVMYSKRHLVKTLDMLDLDGVFVGHDPTVKCYVEYSGQRPILVGVHSGTHYAPEGYENRASVSFTILDTGRPIASTKDIAVTLHKPDNRRLSLG